MNKEIILNKSLFIVLVMTYDRSWKPGIQNGEGKGENSQNFKIIYAFPRDSWRMGNISGNTTMLIEILMTIGNLQFEFKNLDICNMEELSCLNFSCLRKLNLKMRM